MVRICLGQDGFVRLGPGEPISRDQVLSFAQKEGFQGIELHSQFEGYELSAATSIMEYYSKFNLAIPGLQTGHISFFYPPISEDPDVRKEFVQEVGQAQAFAKSLGARHCTLTPPIFVPEMKDHYDRLLDRYSAVVEEVVASAEKHDVVMAIEPEPNLFLNGGTIRDSIDDVKWILEKIKSKNLAILYDIAHVNIVSHGDPVAFLRRLNGRVSWIHVADNDFSLSPLGTARHVTLGEGSVDLVKIFSAFKWELPDLRWFQIDTWEHPDPFVSAHKSKQVLEHTLEETGWDVDWKAS
jgi:sugar phosphate isomerase/epimerase